MVNWCALLMAREVSGINYSCPCEVIHVKITAMSGFWYFYPLKKKSRLFVVQHIASQQLGNLVFSSSSSYELSGHYQIYTVHIQNKKTFVLDHPCIRPPLYSARQYWIQIYAWFMRNLYANFMQWSAWVVWFNIMDDNSSIIIYPFLSGVSPQIFYFSSFWCAL
jgi:hypothetical protein